VSHRYSLTHKPVLFIIYYSWGTLIDETNFECIFLSLTKALNICIQSYVDKLIINIGVDVDVIPDPHHLCDLIIEALRMMNSAAPKKVFHASKV